MIRNRKHGHIGLAVKDVQTDAKWYQDVLGFELIGDFKGPDGNSVKFLKNCDIMYEIYEDKTLPEAAVGKIDHYSFESRDIEADYAYCVKQGYKITTDGIESIPTFWEKGIRYFKIESPTGEQLEFCQRL